ncbi:lysin B [Mycobacterium phage Zakai]|nr:lysin B [Mycobacterium phage Zakai]
MAVGPDGKWIGYGLGDSGIPVLTARQKLKAKFSYAKHLRETTLYDNELLPVLIEYQLRKNVEFAKAGKKLLRTDGILDYATQVAIGVVIPVALVKPLLFTVHGTGQPVPDGPGLPADTARAVLDKWEWQPIGNYPADAFPMWPSILEGVAELRDQIRKALAANPRRKLGFAGYSQGAVVVSLVLKYDFMAQGGEFHDQYEAGQVLAVVTWGNPMRERGVQHGDGWKETAPADTEGILEDRLEGTPAFWREYAHKGDMYAACELTGVQRGDNKRAVCKIVMWHDVLKGENSILAQIAELLQKPVLYVIPLFQSIVDAGLFFAAGLNSPHAYAIGPAIDYLRSV